MAERPVHDWLIIGGGLHGAFAARAVAEAAPTCRLAVLDPGGPLEAWQRRATACGMAYLRSSNAHHLGRRADALRRFAAERGFDAGHELGYYRRPSRVLFETHAREALAGPERLSAAARRLESRDDRWRVHLDTPGPALDAYHVVVATGPNTPYRPTWGAPLEHVYDTDFTLGTAPARAARLAIVGGGISGAQLALRAANLGYQVTWVTRTPPRPADFDSNPCYAGPRCLRPFRNRPLAERTDLLAAARQPGTLPPDIHALLTARLATGEIGWRRGEIAACRDGRLLFADGGESIHDRVILATGFEAIPRANLLADSIERYDLAMDPAGHLMIDDDLQARPGLHVLGRPASLQLGPMAPNIKGARLAGQRLADMARRTNTRAA